MANMELESDSLSIASEDEEYKEGPDVDADTTINDPNFVY